MLLKRISIMLELPFQKQDLKTSEESLPYLLKHKEKKPDAESDFLLVENVCVLLTEQRGITTDM